MTTPGASVLFGRMQEAARGWALPPRQPWWRIQRRRVEMEMQPLGEL